MLLLVSFVSILSSCGDDDPITNNPGVPAGTVMYSADSISVWLSSVGFARDSGAGIFS